MDCHQQFDGERFQELSDIENSSSWYRANGAAKCMQIPTKGGTVSGTNFFNSYCEKYSTLPSSLPPQSLRRTRSTSDMGSYYSARESQMSSDAWSLNSGYEHEDNDNLEAAAASNTRDLQQQKLDAFCCCTKSSYKLRSKKELLLQTQLEWILLKYHGMKMFLLALITGWQSSAFSNWVYVIHSKLTAAQREPLNDVLFNTLPKFNSNKALWYVSEYILLLLLVFPSLLLLSILFLKWRPPHGKPLYVTFIIKRFIVTTFICQILRSISYMITTLPAPSYQCIHQVQYNSTVASQDISSIVEDLFDKTAPTDGNSHEYDPPDSWQEVLFRFDATHGCGDLIFSGHLIWVTTATWLVIKYFNWFSMKVIMIFTLSIMLPFMLAAHKHYSVDIFTSLYVTSLVFCYIWIRYPDQDSAKDFKRLYNIRFKSKIRQVVVENNTTSIIAENKIYFMKKNDGASRETSLVSYNVEVDNLPHDMAKQVQLSLAQIAPSHHHNGTTLVSNRLEEDHRWDK